MDIYKNLPNDLKYIINIYLREKNSLLVYQLNIISRPYKFPDYKRIKNVFRIIKDSSFKEFEDILVNYHKNILLVAISKKIILY